MRKEITKEMQAEILEVFAKEKAVVKVSKILNISVPTIRKYLVKNNIELPRNTSGTEETARRKKEIIKLAMQKKRVAWIAQKVGVTGTYVSRILNKEKARIRGEAKNKINQKCQIRHIKTLQEVADEMNVTREAVRQIQERAFVKLRKNNTLRELIA